MNSIQILIASVLLQFLVHVAISFPFGKSHYSLTTGVSGWMVIPSCLFITVEQGNSQTQVESQIVCWLVCWLLSYLFGTIFTVISHHSPLRIIYHTVRSLHMPSFAYNYDIGHENTSWHVACLSRRSQHRGSYDFNCLFVLSHPVSHRDFIRK